MLRCFLPQKVVQSGRCENRWEWLLKAVRNFLLSQQGFCEHCVCNHILLQPIFLFRSFGAVLFEVCFGVAPHRMLTTLTMNAERRSPALLSFLNEVQNLLESSFAFWQLVQSFPWLLILVKCEAGWKQLQISPGSRAGSSTTTFGWRVLAASVVRGKATVQQ